jgi:hypothetical protein
MDKQKMSVLAKSAPVDGNYSEPKGKTFNAATMAALQETSDIMDGKKKVKWNRFQPDETKTEAKEKLKEMLGS